TKPLRARPGGDVLHVAVRLLHRRPVFLQRPGNEYGGIGLGGLVLVVQILAQLLRLREIFHQFADQLLLLSGWRTVIREQFHALPCADVPQVAAARTAAIALAIRAFQDQSCDSSPSSQAPRPRCSSEMRPLVFFTFCTLSARRRRRSSSLNW